MRGVVIEKPKGSGNWYVVYREDKDESTGKRRQVWKRVKGTKRDAEKQLTKVLHAIDTGAYVKKISKHWPIISGIGWLITRSRRFRFGPLSGMRRS